MDSENALFILRRKITPTIMYRHRLGHSPAATKCRIRRHRKQMLRCRRAIGSSSQVALRSWNRILCSASALELRPWVEQATF
jgi:hypothetical protein